MHKTDLKSFVFDAEIIVRPFISFVTNFEVCKVLSSKLEHFENDIRFCQDI